MLSTRTIGLLVSALVVVGVACTEGSPEEAASSENALVGDILSMTQNEDGTFRVQCRDHATGNPYVEDRITADQVRSDAVCKRAGTTPPSTSSSRGTFTCAGNAEVLGQILSPDGTEKSFRVSTGNWDICLAVAAKLTETRAVISSTTLVAVCGGNAEVSRFSITASGTIQELPKISTGNWDTCRSTQDSINSSSASGTGVRGTFLCTGNAELKGQFLLPDGTEKAISVSTGNWDICSAVAAKLTETRALISGTSLIAVCGGNAEVNRFSVTPAGEVRELPKISTGNWDTCRSTQDTINSSSASGTGVRGSFLCTNNAEVQAKFLLPDGTEKSLSVATGNWDICNAAATTLNQTRALITDTSIIAVCGGTAEVRRFSITAAGDVRELEKISTGNWDTCRAKQTEIDR